MSTNCNRLNNIVKYRLFQQTTKKIAKEKGIQDLEVQELCSDFVIPNISRNIISKKRRIFFKK